MLLREGKSKYIQVRKEHLDGLENLSFPQRHDRNYYLDRGYEAIDFFLDFFAKRAKHLEI